MAIHRSRQSMPRARWTERQVLELETGLGASLPRVRGRA
jgi:hypothetical protein